jgi:hypothetical protein
MFQIDEFVQRLNDRAYLIENLLSFGFVKRINIEFLHEYCKHPSKPSQIYWREIPIIRIRCTGKECDIRIQNNSQNVVFFLLKQIIQLSSVRFISVLLDLRLPSWDKPYEFVIIINRIGKMLIIPTSQKFSSKEIKKVEKHIKIQVSKKISQEKDLELIDIILPESLPLSDFKVRI